jgi:hypothetical protein
MSISKIESQKVGFQAAKHSQDFTLANKKTRRYRERKTKSHERTGKYTRYRDTIPGTFVLPPHYRP